VSVERRDAAPVIHVRGEIDVSNLDAVSADLLATIPLDGPGMILDLTHTTYLASSGVRLLFDIAEHLHAHRQHLVVVVTSERMTGRVVALTKLDDLVPIVTTVDEALTALHDA
jgi:stage II sporulation protein AA (anti-sigma F factor antagonist)